MVHYCCVSGCQTYWKPSCGVHFHRFPVNKLRRAKWLAALHIGGNVSQFLKVCSKHFTHDDYFESATPGYFILKAEAIPSQNLPTQSRKESWGRWKRTCKPANCNTSHCGQTLSTGKTSGEQRACLGSALKSLLGYSDNQVQVQGVITDNNGSLHMFMDQIQRPCLSHVEEGSSEELAGAKATTFALVPCGDSVSDHPLPTGGRLCEVQESMKRRLWKSDHVKQPRLLGKGIITGKMLEDLSGLCEERFNALFALVTNSNCSVPRCKLSAKDQLLLALCKLTHNLDMMFIGTLFEVEFKLAAHIFVSWTDMIYATFKGIDWWNCRMERGSSYKLILGCIEMPAKRSNPEYNEHLNSKLDGSPILKGLVGIDEEGFVVFCSDVYGGSTTDKDMVLMSGLLKKLRPGDCVFADRHFDICDLLEVKGVSYNYPRGDVNQQNQSEVSFGRLQTHMKRLHALKKVHRIINYDVPEHLWSIAFKVFYNCMMLCNFRM